MTPNVRIVSADIDSALDPLATYTALTNRGARTDTMMFDPIEGPTFILDSAAVRIECRAGIVALTALSPNGARLIDRIGVRFAERAVGSSADQLQLKFSRIDTSDCEERLKAPSPFDVVRAVTTELNGSVSDNPFALMALGIIAFDHVDLFENLPANLEDPLGFPDFLFWVADSLVVFEPGKSPRAICAEFAGQNANATDIIQSTSNRLADLVQRCGERFDAPEPARNTSAETNVSVDLDDRTFVDFVTSLKSHIAAGEVYQIVASRTFATPCTDPFAAFAALRRLDPSPYSFFVSGEDFHLFGASPETSVRVFEDDGSLAVELKPIAGTRPRGSCVDEDDRLEAELRLDPKELAEHMMLVDLARNDVARISVPGTRRVSQMMAVERYARVMHLVSKVTGKLRAGLDAVDALKACLNMGTLTGAPKIRATELLRENERSKRGPYGGAIGWLNGQGHLDSAIVIRTAIVKDGIAQVRTGAGIVHDSDPQAEAEETGRKASALLAVLAGADR